MLEFRVTDLSANPENGEPVIVKAATFESAAERALGARLVRAGARRNLRARVYFQRPGQPMNMVRLYAKVADEIIHNVI